MSAGGGTAHLPGSGPPLLAGWLGLWRTQVAPPPSQLTTTTTLNSFSLSLYTHTQARRQNLHARPPPTHLPTHHHHHALPTRLLVVLQRLVVAAGELDKVVAQHPHQDGGQEPRQQQHRDAAVHDGEPVDLRVARPHFFLCINIRCEGLCLIGMGTGHGERCILLVGMQPGRRRYACWPWACSRRLHTCPSPAHLTHHVLL